LKSTEIVRPPGGGEDKIVQQGVGSFERPIGRRSS
jgi:hypothetical protein